MPSRVCAERQNPGVSLVTRASGGRTEIDRRGVHRGGLPSLGELPAPNYSQMEVLSPFDSARFEQTSMQLRLSTLARQEQPNMKKRADRRLLRLSVVSAGVTIVLIAGLFAGLSTPSFAHKGGKPDPSGSATGDKTNAGDGAGHPLLGPEPPHNTDPSSSST